MALLESSEADKFVAHLYYARKQYRVVCERPNKGSKAIERTILSTYQVAQRLGFQDDFPVGALAADTRIAHNGHEAELSKASLTPPPL